MFLAEEEPGAAAAAAKHQQCRCCHDDQLLGEKALIACVVVHDQTVGEPLVDSGDFRGHFAVEVGFEARLGIEHGNLQLGSRRVEREVLAPEMIIEEAILRFTELEPAVAEGLIGIAHGQEMFRLVRNQGRQLVAVGQALQVFAELRGFKFFLRIFSGLGKKQTHDDVARLQRFVILVL